MDYDRFLGLVQHRARMADPQEAVAATRATLETLGRRLAGGAPGNLAAQLPREIGQHLLSQESRQESFSVDDFFEKVSAAEQAELPDSVFHAKVVLDVVKEAVDDATVDKVYQQLPDEWRRLFDAASIKA
ncbi:MAG TPA: DUF2267 domain-containing protein [Actinomycetota bacterium]|nr:DUF2267 domain-containing protein [Actinomycetota bacterium]